jgi:hypothetical protein
MRPMDSIAAREHCESMAKVPFPLGGQGVAFSQEIRP